MFKPYALAFRRYINDSSYSIVAVTRVYDDAQGRHACVMNMPRDDLGKSCEWIGHAYRMPVEHMRIVINPVGMWHQDVKPIGKHQEACDAITALVRWTGKSWILSLYNGSPSRPVNSLALAIGKIEGQLSSLLRRQVSATAKGNRLLLSGMDFIHAYHL